MLRELGRIMADIIEPLPVFHEKIWGGSYARRICV